MKNINILVPLDFSDVSVNALHSAEAVAKLYNGRITPFHSYMPVNELNTPYSFDISSTPMEDYEQIEEALSNRLREMSEAEIDDKYLSKPVVSMGNPAQSIVDQARDFNMIVMNTHGRTGFSRFFLGSVSEKVLRMAHIPVLIVNKERELTGFDRIMVTTDFSEHSKQAFPVAKEIAEMAGSSLELLHVVSVNNHDLDKPDDSVISLREQRLKLLAKEQFHEIGEQLTTKVIASSETPHEAIYNYNLENPHDLIVMSTVGRTGIEYLMMGSTTANVVRHANSAVLSINPKSKIEDLEDLF
jgi:nucleotide-binding universal stress UspA family protein